MTGSHAGAHITVVAGQMDMRCNVFDARACGRAGIAMHLTLEHPDGQSAGTKTGPQKAYDTMAVSKPTAAVFAIAGTAS